MMTGESDMEKSGTKEECRYDWGSTEVLYQLLYCPREIVITNLYASRSLVDDWVGSMERCGGVLLDSNVTFLVLFLSFSSI